MKLKLIKIGSFFLLIFILLSGCKDPGTKFLDISGNWLYRLDSNDIGMEEEWWNKSFSAELNFPGSVQEQGIGYLLSEIKQFTATSPGKEIFENSPIYSPYRKKDNFKLSWALNPSTYYTGPVWFKKEIRIPAAWEGKNLSMYLERVHWFSDVWVDGDHIGKANSLCVPHEFSLPPLTAGIHEIVLRIDNRMLIPIGPNSQSITDHTQTNWNGVTGKMELRLLNDYSIEKTDIYLSEDMSSVTLNCKVRSFESNNEKNELSIIATLRKKDDLKGSYPSIDGTLRIRGDYLFTTIQYPLDSSIKIWDEFHPELYEFNIKLSDNQGIIDEAYEVFGMRRIGIRDKQFTINGKKMFLRGTLENALFPNTGYVPMDVNKWKEEILKAKSYGLNHFRFHSWCPPEAAFVAADELGFYLQVEGPTWPSSVPVNPGTDIAKFITLETERIMNEYGNHPSFVFFACGNEFWGDNGGRSYFPDSLLWYQAPPPSFVQNSEGAEFLSHWITRMKEKSHGRQLFTSSAGWPYIKGNDYHIMHEPYRMRYVFDRLPPSTDIDYSNLVLTHDVPLVSHETGQWCAYPDFSEINNFKDYLKAGNLEIFRDFAIKSGMIDYSEKFHQSSGSFQAILYKQELENLFRTPGSAGFQLLGLQDYHGHGFAPVGVVDAFWDPKNYISPEEFRRFCSEIVPLVRMEKRVWENDEIFSAKVQVAQFSSEDIRKTVILYRVTDEKGRILNEGNIVKNRSRSIDLPQGELTDAGKIQMDLGDIDTAMKLNLEVEVEATGHANDWDFWVYPADLKNPGIKRDINSSQGGVFITSSLDKEMFDRIKPGTPVLFIPSPDSVNAINPGKFETIFWSTWSGTGTLGLHIQNNHPALRDFPTEYHTNWQWWELLRTSLPVDLTGKVKIDEPVVQVIDNWVRAHQLGLIFEFMLEENPVLVCAMDIQNDSDKRVVARQLRYSLVNYMNSDAFHPSSQISLSDFKNMLGKYNAGLSAQGATASVNFQVPSKPISNLIDGNPETCWEGMICFVAPERRQGWKYWKASECDHNYPREHYYVNEDTTKRYWEGYSPYAIAEEAKKYMKQHVNEERPFCLFVSIATPHFPHHTAPGEYMDLYTADKLKLNSNVSQDMRSDALKELQGYYAHCTATDKAIGGIIDEAKLLFSNLHVQLKKQNIYYCYENRFVSENFNEKHGDYFFNFHIDFHWL